jgi:hypothetical protein
MNNAALPYRSLIALTAISPDVSADLRHLEDLIDYAWRFDTGGLVPYEIATVVVPDLACLDRLHGVDLLHHHFDVTWCGCGAPKSAWHWSIHDFRTMVTGYYPNRARHGLAAY